MGDGINEMRDIRRGTSQQPSEKAEDSRVHGEQRKGADFKPASQFLNMPIDGERLDGKDVSLKQGEKGPSYSGA